LERSGDKYVRHQQHEPLLHYRINQDPEERVKLPVSQDMASAIEGKMKTYLTLAYGGWESKRGEDTFVGRTFPGSAIAQWGKGACITIVPEEMRGAAFVEPVLSQECKNNADPGARSVLRAFAAPPFEAGGRVEFQLRIADGEDLQGKQLQALARTSAMEKPIAVEVLPRVGEWQTVSLVLPKAEVSSDAVGGQRLADTLIGIAPLNLPVRFAIRSIKIEPLGIGVRQRMWGWISRFTGSSASLFSDTELRDISKYEDR
jgi:hypothetical protein